MAVAFGTSSSLTEATRTNSVYTAPSGISDGDLLLIWHFEYSGSGAPPTPTPPGGFAVVPGPTWPVTNGTGSGDEGDVWLWYKIASSEAGNYTVTHASATTRGIMARVTGADTTTPFTPNTRANTGSANPTNTTVYLSLTTVIDSELILAFGTDWGDTSNNLSVPTNVGGGASTTPVFTERVDFVGEYLATGILSPATTTGNKEQTNNCTSGSNDPWFSAFVAVQSASAPPPSGPRIDVTIGA